MLTNSIDYGFNQKIAQKYDIKTALVLNRLVWSINIHEQQNQKDFFIDGKWWCYDSAKSIANHFPGILCERSVKSVIAKLKEDRLLFTSKMKQNKWDQTNWYAINEEKYQRLIGLDNKHQKDNLLESEIGQELPFQSGEVYTLDRGNDALSSTLLNSPSNSLSKDINPPSAKAPAVPDKLKYSDEDLSLAHEWLNYSKEFTPGEPNKAWTPERFATEIAKTKRVSGITHEDMIKALEFVRSDEEFWQTKALSPASLYGFSKSNGLRKIQNILTSMKGVNRNEKYKRETYLENPGKYKKGWSPEDGI